MAMMKALISVFLAAFLSLQAWAAAPFVYLGPVTTIDNGIVSVDVAVQVGRITGFRRKGEENWIKVDDSEPHPGWNWNPWGGDRVWPTAQGLNPQIYKNYGFDPVIDGAPWELISRTATSLEIRSGVSKELGLRITRRIQILDNSAVVEHSFLVERLAPSIYPVHVWAVTGVREADYLLMESDPRVKHAGWKAFKWWTSMTKDAPTAALVGKTRVVHMAKQTVSSKIGTYGRWVASVGGTSAFLQTVNYEVDGLYLEESSLQAFWSGQEGFCEIETLSPSWFLQKGERRSWVVRWELVKFPDTVSTVGDRVAFLGKQGERN